MHLNPLGVPADRTAIQQPRLCPPGSPVGNRIHSCFGLGFFDLNQRGVEKANHPAVRFRERDVFAVLAKDLGYRKTLLTGEGFCQ